MAGAFGLVEYGGQRVPARLGLEVLCEVGKGRADRGGVVSPGLCGQALAVGAHGGQRAGGGCLVGGAQVGCGFLGGLGLLGVASGCVLAGGRDDGQDHDVEDQGGGGTVLSAAESGFGMDDLVSRAAQGVHLLLLGADVGASGALEVHCGF